MCKLENKTIKVLIYRLTNIILNFIIFLFKIAYTTLHEKSELESELETYNSFSNPSENEISDRLIRDRILIYKTSNGVRLNSISNQRRNNSETE